MKNLIIILFFLPMLFISCEDSGKVKKEDPFVVEWKNNDRFFNTFEEAKEEIKIKMERLNSFMDENNLAGMLFTQVRNINWITAGRVNTQIVLNKDVGAASLLIMKDGKKYVIASGSEIPRMMDEDLKDLGYEAKEYNWYEANPVKDVRGEIIKEIGGTHRIGSDIDFPGTVNVAAQFEPLRYSFTEEEIKRYSWLAEQCTEAVSEVCKKLRPGMDEFEIEALTAIELRARGIFPTVLLMGVDDRIFSYRHALPGGQELEKYAMVNIVAEKWGMPIAVTRFVHFGELPEELANKLEKTAIVNAHYEKATVPGKPAIEIFEEMKNWYADAGFEGEWKKHHQGGAIGYNDREYVIYPGIEKTVQVNQPFAWNPTITGAKVEETIIAKEGALDVLTKSPDWWPMINVEIDGKVYPQPGILILNPDNYEIVKQENKTIKGDQID